MSRKVIFAGSFAGVAALALGLAAYRTLTDSDGIRILAADTVASGRNDTGSTLVGASRNIAKVYR